MVDEKSVIHPTPAVIAVQEKHQKARALNGRVCLIAVDPSQEAFPDTQRS